MYAFIDNNRGRYPVGMMARALKISPRSYYDYKAGIPSRREQKREELEGRIQVVYAAATGRAIKPRSRRDKSLWLCGVGQYSCKVYEAHGLTQ